MAQIPDKTAQTTTVRIGAGTSANSKDSKSCNNPGIRLFDVLGRPVGQQAGSSARLRTEVSQLSRLLHLKMSVRDKRNIYLSVVSGGNDALCIAYIAVTWPDRGQQTWTGDIGYQCGGYWYESQTTMNPSTNYIPKCMWIDSDGSNVSRQKGWASKSLILRPAMIAQASIRKTAKACVAVRQGSLSFYNDIDMKTCMSYFDPPLQFTAGLIDVDRSKVVGVPGSKTCTSKKMRRGGIQAVAAKRLGLPSINKTTSLGNSFVDSFLGRLITSSSTSHSAIGLCGSATSLGPDFVAHHESTYYDMANKQTYPL